MIAISSNNIHIVKIVYFLKETVFYSKINNIKQYNIDILKKGNI